MNNVQEKFIAEPDGEGGYLVMLPDGSVKGFKDKDAVLAMIQRRGKRKVKNADMHTATIEWRENS
jgi:hypothetical protein